jgi:hypothetical protein
MNELNQAILMRAHMKYPCLQTYYLQASLKEIDRMIELEIVQREGKARASYYVMK